MYKVRKLQEDEKSQVGAFESLQNAKLAAHNAGIDFNVYDENGNLIFSPTATDWFRVRSSWQDEASQVGAYWNLDIAKSFADSSGKTVFDWDGNPIYIGKIDTTVVESMSYKATLLKKIRNLPKGKTVTVKRNTKKDWIIVEDGGTVARKNIKLTKQIYKNTVKYSAAVAETWINDMKIGSKTEWLFWCNKYGQRAYIFKGKKGAWKLQKVMKCSTGSIKYGEYSDQGIGFKWKIWDKEQKFQGPHGYQYYNMHYTSLYGNSIHQRSGSGNPATHGCIGLAKTNAIWAFKNLPVNTRVVVY